MGVMMRQTGQSFIACEPQPATLLAFADVSKPGGETLTERSRRNQSESVL
jgi:hypothetical protein